MLDELHNKKMLSVLRISKEIGKSYMKMWGLYRALEIPTRNVAEADRNSAEARSKHKRTSFDGSEEDKAYLIGFANGDLTSWQVSGTAIMVTSTTTHPAFVDLFHRLFDRYGHVYEYPMYEEGKEYKWKVAVRLDNSFRFLLRTPIEALRWATSNRLLFLSWLAGLVDSDGSINVTASGGYVRVMLTLHNEDRILLEALKRHLKAVGYQGSGPYRVFSKGETTLSGIRYKDDMWNLQIQRTSEAQNLLRELPLRHGERMARKEQALSISPAARWSDIEAGVLRMRRKIKGEVRKFIEQAKEEYQRKHHEATA